MIAAARIFESDRRRAALAALLVAPRYTLALRALRNQIEAVGYVVSLDVLQADLGALADLGLVERIELDHAMLTDRGADVAMGRTAIPGVGRAEPGELA